MNNVYQDIKIAGIVVIIIFITTVLVDYFLGSEMSLSQLRSALLYNFYYGFPLSFLNGWFFSYLNKLIPWDKKPRRRALVGLFGSILLTMGTLVILNFILWTQVLGNPISILWIQNNRTFYLVSIIITIIASVTLHAISFFKEVQKERKVNDQLRQEKLAMELNALRAHVDPHFLFNSFNVLSGLIEEDKNKAQSFLAGLSKIYRYILEQRNEETSSVQEELEFAKAYLNLQQMRFEDSIVLQTNLSNGALLKSIPSLSLQLLLENAIKHNGFDAQQPLQIEILEDEGHLVVRNNRRKRQNLITGSKMGLQNIKARYDLLSDRSLQVEAAPHFFTVKLPLI